MKANKMGIYFFFIINSDLIFKIACIDIQPFVCQN